MSFPVVTSVYAALFALLFVALSAWVMAGRLAGNVIHGDGGHEWMQRRIRAHGNFAEYVPLILLNVALLEGGGAARATVHGLLLPLLVARGLHPMGMLAPVGSVRQYATRGVPVIVTVVVMVVAAVLLLREALSR